MKADYRVLIPLDVLYPRGNRLFGEAGDHAEPQMPPWPSVFAGALRSLILVQQNVDLEKFSRGEIAHAILGTPSSPGSFAVTHVSLARRTGDGWQALFPLPADVLVSGGEAGPAASDRLQVSYARPVALKTLEPLKISSPEALESVPVLRLKAVEKIRARTVWLTPGGLRSYMGGEPLQPDAIVRQDELWKIDPRLGIALDRQTRTAAEGRIYTTDAVALCPCVGFLVGIAGAQNLLPSSGVVRLSGDGRGAELQEVAVDELWLRLPRTRSFRVVLRTPALSPHGWLPPGLVQRQGFWELQFGQLRARLVAALVPPHQVVSGWDLARWQPKPAVRAIPAGAVYWFRTEQEDRGALERLVTEGFWALLDRQHAEEFASRKPEGWNQVLLADWNDTD
jgi:CRISPR-associated protein Cmr3